MLASMGFDSNTVLSSDLRVAWRIAGNGLSVAHAWLQIHKTCVLFGTASPVSPDGQPVEQVAALQVNAAKLSSCCLNFCL